MRLQRLSGTLTFMLRTRRLIYSLVCLYRRTLVSNYTYSKFTTYTDQFLVKCAYFTIVRCLAVVLLNT